MADTPPFTAELIDQQGVAMNPDAPPATIVITVVNRIHRVITVSGIAIEDGAERVMFTKDILIRLVLEETITLGNKPVTAIILRTLVGENPPFDQTFPIGWKGYSR